MGDGVAERVYLDSNADSANNATETAVTAYFTQFTSTLYMSFDVSCETGLSSVEPCLQKGDLIFITDANWGKSEQLITKAGSTRFFGGSDTVGFGSGYADTSDLYTITKIWKSEETTTTSTFEDKFRITVDKNINWDGSVVADPDGDGTKNTGYVQIVKFTPATPSASASRATRTTTATRRARSRSKQPTRRAGCRWAHSALVTQAAMAH